MEKNWKERIFFRLFLGIVLIFSQLSLIGSQATFITVWEEDFDNFEDIDDLEGWTLSCIHSKAPEGYYNETATGCTIDNKQLYFNSTGLPWHKWTESVIEKIPLEYYNYTRLMRPTTVANGTWNFDMYFGPEPCTVSCVSLLMETSPINFLGTFYGYGINVCPYSFDPVLYETNGLFTFLNPEGFTISGQPHIVLWKKFSSASILVGIYQSDSIQNDTWYHFNVTRDYDQMKVYIDGVLRIEYEDSTPMEDYWSSSPELYFMLGSHGGTRFDNVTVTNLTQETTTTTTTEPPTTEPPTTTEPDNGGTPGFEMVSALIIITLVIITIRRRHK